MTASTTPFGHLLDTNFVPSGPMQNEVSGFLVKQLDNLRCLDEDVARMEQQLSVVRKTRDDLKQHINAHHQLLTSFRRLPDDMLVEIFLWCLPDTRNATMSTCEAPLLLGRVCSRWRSVTYHSPRLWSSLHIPCPVLPDAANPYPHMAQRFKQIWFEFETKLALHTSAVEAWLNRSGSCPLALSFNPRESTSLSSDRCVTLYLDILLKFTDRWFDIQITVPPGDHSTALASIPASSLPMLTHLDLKFGSRSPYPTATQWSSCGLLTAPTLSSLRISQYPHDIHAIQMDGCWSNLTRLSVHNRSKNLSLKETYHLLSHSPKLQFCSLKIMDTNDARIINPISNAPLLFPDLHTLIIAESAWHISTLLSLLSLPALHSLSYHSSFIAVPARPSPLITLITHSGCSSSLKHLISDIFNFNLENLFLCMSLTPNLTHYTNRTSSFPTQSRDQSILKSSLPVAPRLRKSLLNILTPGYLHDEGERKWPNLQYLELKETIYIPDTELLSFIHGRMGSAGYAPLRSLRIQFHSVMITDLRPSLAIYADKLRVDFIYPSQRSLGVGAFPAHAGVVGRVVQGEEADDFTVY